MVKTVTEADYSGHTVSQLKDGTQNSKGLKVSGKKSDLDSTISG